MRARLLASFCLYLAFTFCWIVLIEHGPENFWDGARIEFENLEGLFAELSHKASFTG
jgi:hypothetical protein